MNIRIFEGSTQRVDRRLTQEYKYSRSFFHHIISRGGVIVNGIKVKKSYKLKTNDTIQIDNLKRYLSPVILEEAPYIDIPIIKEEEDYLIINKPKGVLAHPNSIWDMKTPSVVSFLYHHYKNLPSIGSFIRAGIIHRLDKDTNGLMIIAKTENGLSHFKLLFQQKSKNKTIEEKEQVPLKKYYRAICQTTPLAIQFLNKLKNTSLPYYIQENVIAKVPNPSIKFGITKILKFYDNEDTTVTFDIEILTGRTHQIRYHLSKKGFPIVGDYLYGKESSNKMQLTAYQISFQDMYSNEVITVKI